MSAEANWWDADPVAPSQAEGNAPSARGRPVVVVQPPNPQYNDAISKVESGGNYGAMGPVTRNGDRAHGKYQVMGANIGPWTKEVFGQEMTPHEFLSNPQAQDAVFNHKFNSYLQQTGNPQDAASMWFTGKPLAQGANRRDQLGTTGADYVNKFTSALGPNQANAAPQQAGGNWWANDKLAQPDQTSFDQRFAQSPGPSQNPAALQAGLKATAQDMTRGPELSPGQQMSGEASNILPAASQGTAPNAGAYGGKLISAEAHQSDSGEVLYRDPQTGQIKPTDSKTQVALRDPKDGIVKIHQRSEATNEGGVTGAARVLAPGLASGAVTARAALPAANKIMPKASDIFSTSKPYYRAFTDEAGKIEVPKETAAGFAERIRSALGKANFIQELADPVYKAVAILDKGVSLTLDELQNIKRVIGKSFNSPEKNVRDAASVATREIGKIISEVSPSAAKNLKTADEIHSTARGVQELQRKGEVAGLRAGRAGYGGNATNNMRQVLSPIVQRAIEGKVTGFKPDEIQAMREIVEGTTSTNAARGVGQLSPAKGVIQTLTAMGAAAFAGPVALAIPALGMASNKLATFMTGKQIERLKELVSKRSPAYAEAVTKAVDRYHAAQMELANNPSPAKFSAYLSASRSLSSGMTRDGIPVSSGDLIRAIQGAIPTRADDENPKP